MKMDSFEPKKVNNKCIVRIIVNPSQPQKYTISRFLNGDMSVVLNVQNVDYDIDYMAQMIHDDIVVKRKYDVRFNFSSTPAQIRENLKFREKMLSIFQLTKPKFKPITKDIETIVEIVRLHSAIHGNAPDMKKYYLPKQMHKIRNYIRNVVNNINLSTDDTDVIARRLADISD